MIDASQFLLTAVAVCFVAWGFILISLSIHDVPNPRPVATAAVTLIGVSALTTILSSIVWLSLRGLAGV